MAIKRHNIIKENKSTQMGKVNSPLAETQNSRKMTAQKGGKKDVKVKKPSGTPYSGSSKMPSIGKIKNSLRKTMGYK